MPLENKEEDSLFSKADILVVDPDVVSPGMARGGVSHSITATDGSLALLSALPSVGQPHSLLVQVAERLVCLSVFSTHMGVLRVRAVLLKNWRTEKEDYGCD